jgi:hypothetical protein
MDLEFIEERFSSYLKKFGDLKNFHPFALAYIRLLLLFRDELSERELAGLQKRRGQLLGGKSDGVELNDLRKISRKKMEGYLRNDESSSRDALINSLIFGALLETEETHFFYMTEPMFEFAEEMGVAPEKLEEILESEFSGFEIS